MVAHCLLDLSFEQSTFACQTALIELVPDRGYLVLDTLNPAPPAKLLGGAPGVHVRTRLNGVDIGLRTHLVQRGESAGIPFFKAPYPLAIDYPQRRREYRVNVPLANGVSLTVADHAGRELRGELRDLSPNGFAARVTRGDLATIAAADGWRGRCEIALPGAEPLIALVEVCHVLPARGRSVPRIGACFIDLDARTERRIERYVAELERQRVRLR